MNRTTPVPLTHQAFLALYYDAAKALPLLEHEAQFAQFSGPAWMQELAVERFELVASFLLSSIYEYGDKPDVLLRVQAVVLEVLADGENEDEEWQEEHSPPPPPQDSSQKKVRPKKPRKSYWKPKRYDRRLVVKDAGPGFLNASIKSATKDDGTRWHPEINRHGQIRCDCPDARYRPWRLCKHAKKVLSAAKRRRML